MTSVIPDIESTIAQALRDTGWPGADQVDDLIQNDEQEAENDEDQQEEIVAEDDQDTQEEVNSDEDEASQNDEETQDQEEETEEASPVSEQKYQPKWKKAALKVLEGLPEEQQELLRQEDKRREEAFHKGIDQYRESSKRAAEYDEVVKPYLATINSVGATPTQAIQHLLAADHNLRYSQPAQKVGFMLKIMQDYSINPQDLIAAVGAVGEQRQVDPEVRQLQQTVYQMQNSQQMAQQQAIAAQQAQVDAQIAAFSADPDNEHFEILRPMMAKMAEAQPEATLRDLYDQAFKIHPKTSAIWEAQQQQKWSDQRKAKLQSVKKPTNVRSNGRSAAANPTKAATMDETIQAKARELGLM